MLRQSDLVGFQLPGMSERLITTLFADDTTVYLAQQDDYARLQHILASWCLAAGAKFNLNKTEIIPIGTTDYRSQVAHTRRLNALSDILPPDVHVVPDGLPVRVLGVWIGNAIDQLVPWTALLKKMQLRLQEWDRQGTTIISRVAIVNMEVGGRIQYLAKVQGVPPPVITAIKKIIQNFIWRDKRTPPINLDTLCLPPQEGGLGLLDIATRINAITLTWLKPFLDLSPTRPTWAYAADSLLALHAKKQGPTLDNSVKLNVFLQNWSVSTAAASPLPHYLKDMILLAKRAGVNFNAIKLGPSLKRKMPLWLH
ncbi:hypothetical protein BDW22DRAFT_1337497, partial [Trametopsis cervina]